MPITIDGTGSISGLNAGGLPDNSITTADIAANAVTYAKLGTTEQGQLCKAWVNFNGTGVVAIRAQYNVSSITDNGTGDYTVNFTTAMADANYAPTTTLQINTSGGSSGDWNAHIYSSAAAQSTGSLRMAANNGSGGYVDPTVVTVAIFR